MKPSFWLLVWSTLLAVSSTHIAHAQILDNNEGNTFGEDPFFNADFIARNKIKQIHGELSTKKERDRIRKGKMEYDYHFEEDGKMEFQLNSMLRTEARTDSSFIHYYYREDGTIETKRLNDTYGFYSYDYETDAEGQVVKETYFRDENVGTSRFNFQLGKQYIISSEAFAYENIGDSIIVKQVFNNYGKAYMEHRKYYNKLGYKTMEESRYIIGNRRSRTTFEYDEKGRISKKIEQHDLRNDKQTITTYLYDDVGNLLEENIYQNDTHVTHREFLYDERMFLSAIISKDVATNIISIVKYTYTFYE